MKLTKAQNEIASDLHRFRVVCCGRRFGKTTEAVNEIKAKALSKPSKIAYIAPTYQQARDIAWEQLKNAIGDLAINVNESRLEIKIRALNGGESIATLRGWESIQTLRGQYYDLLILDEVAQMRGFWTNWHEVIRPTLTDTKGEAIFISTPLGFNHFYELYGMEAKDRDYKSFHFTSYDNPHLPKEEIDKAREELTEDRFAQEYLADFRKTEGLVYKEFDRARHLFDGPVINPVANFAGIDFGFTNPTAVIHLIKDYDNKFYVTKEWYKTNKTDEEIADYVFGCKFNYVYADPEAPSSIEALRRKGVNLREVVKAKDSIRNGISAVRELFKQGRLFIHKDCENLIWELETYSYPEKDDFKNEYEDPIKENDHALDALRYAIMMQSSVSQNKASVFVPNHLPIIIPPVIPQQGESKPKVFYPKNHANN